MLKYKQIALIMAILLMGQCILFLFGSGERFYDLLGWNPDDEFRIETVATPPGTRIQIWRNFVSPEICAHLKSLAVIKGMSRALITPYGATGLVESNVRTNTMAWLDFNQDHIVSAVEDRIADLTGTKPDWGENMQILRYQKGQQFEAHRDAHDPEEDPPEEFEPSGNRIVTVVIYLAKPEKGGETHFTELGIKVLPNVGDAVMFWNVKEDGALDKAVWHAGLPPLKGEKWVATKWIHERRYQQQVE